MNQAHVFEKCESEMEKALQRFKEETKKIHTGRATPILVEDILVDYYGSKTPIKQIAAINIPEPRQIVIAPWSKNDLVAIQKAIEDSDLRVNPQNDGEIIRITLPALTQERRIELKKIVGKEKEKARISVRQIREDSWEEIKEAGVSEDEKYKAKEKLQQTIDKFNKLIEELAEKKEEEIMTI